MGLVRGFALAFGFLFLLQTVAKAKVDVLVTEVRIEGNTSLSAEKIRNKIKSRPNRLLDDKIVDEDIKTLTKTNWFASVEHRLDKDPTGKGVILVFKVLELPFITNVEWRGRTRFGISEKELEKNTGIKKGERFEFFRNRAAVQQIQNLYREKGFDLAEVRLLKGGLPEENEVIFSIFEGPKFQIEHVDFQGNAFVSDAVLLTKVTNKRKWLGILPGSFQRDMIDEDVRKLREYYEGNGFLISKASWMVRPTKGGKLGSLTLTFVIEEGIQYHINNVSFEGNKKISTSKLEGVLKLKKGMAYNEPIKELDLKSIQIEYNEIGCIKTQVVPTRKATDNKQGLVDIIWRIEEGEPFDLGEIIVRGNDRTQDRVIRREANMAGLVPQQPFNRNRMELFRQRLANLGYFQNNPEKGKPIDIQIINERPASIPFAEQKTSLAENYPFTRGQDPDPPAQLFENQGVGANQPPAASAPDPLSDDPAPGSAGGAFPFGLGDRFEPPVDTFPQPLPPDVQGAQPPVIGPGIGNPNQSPYPPQNRTPPVDQGVPPTQFPSLPGTNMSPPMPDRQDPFANRSIADVLVQLDEMMTGAFRVSLGASSYGGLFAQVSIFENNFNLFKVPTSFDDLFNGRAFRGAGQQLNITIQAGTLINMGTVSLTDPYLFDLPVMGTVAGSAFTRIYPDWLERRIGPKIALGRQFGTSIYADVSATAEAINFYGYRTPTPAAYLAASGTTFLTSIKPTLRYDNRNNPFNPSSGEYVEMTFMQAWGSFTFPQATIEGRKYFTTGSRADGSGKRTLLLRGVYGATGRDTPVYERFFAGDFRSFRGFWYRGVGPHVFGANVGGFTELLGSIEYMVPLTAGDRIAQVFFCDFGTINQSYAINNFRATIGTGLRLQIPGFSVLPLALDLAFPVVKQPGDVVRFFSFNVGASF